MALHTEHTSGAAAPSTLSSTFALQQLASFARSTDKVLFLHMLMSVFGTDVPVAAYVELYDNLRADTVPNPPYRLDERIASLATFDEASHSIAIKPSAVEQALSEAAANSNLFSAMLQAFGVYLHSTLRQGAASAAQSAMDIGVSYAAMITFCTPIVANGTLFATFDSGDRQHDLTLMPFEAEGETLPTPEKFEAGKGHDGAYTHGAIAKGLATANFTEEQIRSIYFGNWLRDYSQLLDPKLVRKPTAPIEFPKLPRPVLTQIVDLLALEEFNDLQSTAEDRQTYTVTTAMLGVYRPSEHIDNPLLAEDKADPRTIDSDFEAAVYPGDPLLSIDTERSMARYIDNSRDYMYRRLIDAMQAGNTPLGRRYFGEALHVLEDYFAHSNFVELCLHQRGHDSVLPWTLQRGQHGLAIITGTFSGLDIIASIAGPLGKRLFSVEDIDFKLIKPGDRSDSEKVLNILLKEYGADTAWTLMNGYLEFRDKAAADETFKRYQTAAWIVNLPAKLFTNAMNSVMRQLLEWIADNIATAQTLSGSNPNEVAELYPSHSQLAKDHASHPLHELAGLMAMYAVEQVGVSMQAYWSGETDRDPATLATSFLIHPRQDDWHEDIVAAWEAKDREEARASISKASSYDDLQALQKQNWNEELERTNALLQAYQPLPQGITDVLSNFGFGLG